MATEIRTAGWTVFWIALALVAAVFLWTLGFLPALAPPPRSEPRDPAVALALIAAAAVTIERVLELGWTLLGQWLGTGWPRGLTQAVSSYVTLLDSRLTSYIQGATTELQSAQQAGRLAGEELAKVRTQLEAIQTAAGNFQREAPDERRVQQVAALITDTTATLQRGGAAIGQAHQVAMTGLDQLSSFLSTFSDDPGRRLISIVVGTILGLLVAGFVGLDLFQVAGETSSTLQQTAGAGGGPRWGVGLTGLAMGLGSGPTHDLIRAVQEFKKAQKGG